MTHLFKKHAVALSLTLALGTAVADEPVATVDGEPIPAARVEVMLKEQRQQGIEETDELREAVREELIRRQVLTQAAEEHDLHEREDVRAQLDLGRQAILIRAYLRDYAERNPVTDEEIEARYEQLKPQLGGGEEFKARHILVETEAEAEQAVERLQAGEDFTDLAAELSQDPGSKDEGGDLGWNAADMFVGPFAQALTELEPGSFTEQPVASDYGYHVILLEDTREGQPPALEEVSDQIRQQLRQQRVEGHLMELREQADVK